MSTALEDRLTAALHARAELVQPEDLGHQTLRPATRTPLWRRPAVVALVAAAAVVAVSVPLVLRGDHTGEHPLPATNGIPQPVHALSGDVDGDGKPDRLRAEGSTLTVALAADPGHPITLTVSHLVGLIGLTDAAGRGQGVVVATSGTSVKGGRGWQVYALAGPRTLRGLAVSLDREGSGLFTGTTLGVVPGLTASWITPAGQLMMGTLDPAQRKDERLAVAVSRFAPEGNQLVEKPVGHWCWDTATQGVPAPCPSGVTDAYDPGPHGSLPSLLPRLSPDFMLPGDTWRDGSTVVHLVKGNPHTASFIKQTYDVVGTIDGHQVSARAGYAMPRVLQTFVDLGHGVRGLVGVDDSLETWNLLAVSGDGLVPVAPPDPSHGGQGETYLHPGTLGLIEDGTARTADTWIGADGHVFTRVATDRTGRFRTYEWQVTDSSGTRLRAVDLGTLCIDDFWGTYGTCS